MISVVHPGKGQRGMKINNDDIASSCLFVSTEQTLLVREPL